MASKMATRERAEEIFRLKALGNKPADIALLLGIHQATVYRELTRFKGHLATRIKGMSQGEGLCESVAKMELIEAEALRNYELTPEKNPSGRIGFLNLALRARERIIATLQEAGVIIKIPEIPVGEGLFFEDDEIRQEYLKLLIKSRKKAAEQGKLKLIQGGKT